MRFSTSSFTYKTVVSGETEVLSQQCCNAVFKVFGSSSAEFVEVKKVCVDIQSRLIM